RWSGCAEQRLAAGEEGCVDDWVATGLCVASGFGAVCGALDPRRELAAAEATQDGARGVDGRRHPEPPAATANRRCVRAPPAGIAIPRGERSLDTVAVLATDFDTLLKLAREPHGFTQPVDRACVPFLCIRGEACVG